MKRFIAIFLLLSTTFPCLATVITTVEPTSISIGDSFKFTLTVDSAIDATPDFSVLDDSFTIIGTEKSVNYMVINQRAKSMIEWTLYLTPKKVGQLEIPAIMVGTDKSEAKTITVSTDLTQPQKQEPGTTNKPLDMQDSLDVKTPYVHQQIIYTVKIFNKTNILDAAFVPPSVENALFIPIGSGERTQTMIKGDIYAVETLKYAIFPQKSGKFVIHPAKFTALIEDFPPQKVVLEGKPTTLDIKPIPNNQPSWLPAKSLTLTEDSPITDKPFHVGDTLTRSITLKAEGMPAQLLPNLTLDDGEGFQAYPEKPMIKNQFRGETLIGLSTTKITYVLNEPGKLILPEIQIHWFNTNTQQLETTTLAAETLTVDGSAVAKINDKAALATPPPSSLPPVKFPLRPHPFALLFLGLLTYAGFHTWKQHKSKKAAPSPTKALKGACHHHQAHKAKQALLAYFAHESVTIINLSTLQDHLNDPTLKQAINELNHQLYNPTPHKNWDGKRLWLAFDAYLKTKETTPIKKSSIPPLNPE